MKKVIGILLIIFCATCLVGCNKENKKDEKNVFIGEWIADGTQNEFVTGANGEIVGGKKPYYLTIDEDGKYTLKMDNYTEKGTYTIDDKNISFKNSDGLISEECRLENDDELLCNNYASLYKKVEDKK